MDTGENASTLPCKSTLAREFGFEDKPITDPCRSWIAAEKLGATDRSVKPTRPSRTDTFLIASGIAGAVPGAAAVTRAVGVPLGIAVAVAGLGESAFSAAPALGAGAPPGP